jgi:hypothetical protein
LIIKEIRSWRASRGRSSSRREAWWRRTRELVLELRLPFTRLRRAPRLRRHLLPPLLRRAAPLRCRRLLPGHMHRGVVLRGGRRRTAPRWCRRGTVVVTAAVAVVVTAAAAAASTAAVPRFPMRIGDANPFMPGLPVRVEAELRAVVGGLAPRAAVEAVVGPAGHQARPAQVHRVSEFVVLRISVFKNRAIFTKPHDPPAESFPFRPPRQRSPPRPSR